jgi:hypothetical protein
MPKATLGNGSLEDLNDCWIYIPDSTHIYLNALPDISDSKSATYNDEPIIGRSFPLKTFSHSDNRSISMQLHFYITKPGDALMNLKYIRALQSAVYPRTGNTRTPYVPPPVCQIKCGSLLSSDPLSVVLKQYSVKFPTDVPWDKTYYTPWKLDVDTTWETVYITYNLPGQEKIMRDF